MALFALYQSRSDATALPAVVPERFSWFAALLPPVHALAHGLWDQLVLVIIGLVLVVATAVVAGGDAAFWAYVLLAVACGLGAPGAERRALQRRGFTLRGYRIAPAADLARLDVLEGRP